MKVLIIIPAYNEAENIEKTVNDVIQNTDYDYVVVNDCSKDNTKEVCEKINFNMLSLPINYGLTSGIQIGMKYAYKNNYDIAIQFDGDGQHQAKYLKNLVKEIEDGNANIVIGSRFVTNTSLTPEPDTMVYMLKKGLKIKEVQVEMKEREFGKSYLTPIKSMKYMVNMIFSIVFIRAITRKK